MAFDVISWLNELSPLIAILVGCLSVHEKGRLWNNMLDESPCTLSTESRVDRDSQWWRRGESMENTSPGWRDSRLAFRLHWDTGHISQLLCVMEAMS